MELACFSIVSGPKSPNCATSLSLLLLTGTKKVAEDSVVVELVPPKQSFFSVAARLCICFLFFSITYFVCFCVSNMHERCSSAVASLEDTGWLYSQRNPPVSRTLFQSWMVIFYEITEESSSHLWSMCKRSPGGPNPASLQQPLDETSGDADRQADGAPCDALRALFHAGVGLDVQGHERSGSSSFIADVDTNLLFAGVATQVLIGGGCC